MTTIMDRRTFLRGAGVALALPWLESLAPAKALGEVPRRMVAIETNQGILPQEFFPKEPGKDYPLTPYLEILKDFRDDFTVFSGVSHPQVDGFHQAEKSFLTAAPHPGSAAFRNTISPPRSSATAPGSRRFRSSSARSGTAACPIPAAASSFRPSTAPRSCTNGCSSRARRRRSRRPSRNSGSAEACSTRWAIGARN